jgi:hypothetical protein
LGIPDDDDDDDEDEEENKLKSALLLERNNNGFVVQELWRIIYHRMIDGKSLKFATLTIYYFLYLPMNTRVHDIVLKPCPRCRSGEQQCECVLVVRHTLV